MKQTKWLDDRRHYQTRIGHGRHRETSYFGYRSVPVDTKAKWVMHHFNTVAEKYDLMNTLLSFGIHHLWKRTAVRAMNLEPGDRVLDVCGGTGDLAILAARAVAGSGRVVLYDINRAMIDTGRHKIGGNAHGGRITFVQGDAQQLSFPDERFDAAMVGFGIRNVPRMDRGFEEMCRVLKPGGKLMCLEFSKPTAPLFRLLYDFYSFHIMPFLGEIIVGSRRAYTHLPESIRTFALPAELTAIIENAGFSRVSTHSLTNGIAMIHLAVKT